MLVPIPYAMTYTATAGGAVWKVVLCEYCQKLFAYQMQRSVTGAGTSLFFLNNAGASDRARADAMHNLLQTLERDYDTIPCPQCGNYQNYMLWGLRMNHWVGLCYLGSCLLVLSLILFGVSYLFAINTSYNPDVPMLKRFFMRAGIAVAGLGIASFVSWAILGWRYDPNNAGEHEKRLQDGKSRTVYGSALDKMLKETLTKIDGGIS